MKGLFCGFVPGVSHLHGVMVLVLVLVHDPAVKHHPVVRPNTSWTSNNEIYSIGTNTA